MRVCLSIFVVAVIAVTGATAAQAGSIGVSYEVTGSAGDWTLDFSVTNNIDADQHLYFFGVDLLTGKNHVSMPTDWMVYGGGAQWNNVPYGGGGTFNNNWITNSTAGILFGDTLTGFKVKSTETAAPTSVAWFAYSFGTSFISTGTNLVYKGTNPGFEDMQGATPGGATPGDPVPEPTTLGLFGLGAAGLALVRRRKARLTA